MAFVDWLVRRAQRTPYFDLPGYMLRYWVVPPFQRNPRIVWSKNDDGTSSPVFTNDGTGPLSFRDRPFSAAVQWFGVNARVHIILRSDKERDPHDHPTNYISVCLAGRGVEQRFNEKNELVGETRYWPGKIIFRRATDRHILTLPEGGTLTTLFIRGRKLRDWGFHTPEGFVPWRDYEQRDAGRT